MGAIGILIANLGGGVAISGALEPRTTDGMGVVAGLRPILATLE
jgi:hypothetical protein